MKEVTKLIVGLGNPGSPYQTTRHNLGFLALDQAAGKNRWSQDNPVRVCPVDHALLIEPLGMMNNSGPVLLQWLQKKKIPWPDVPARLWVVHDDLDIPAGEVRVQFDRSAAGHNGVQSIMDALGTQAFHRIRIGLGSNQATGIPAEEYVLQPIPPGEQGPINQGLRQAVDIILRLTREA